MFLKKVGPEGVVYLFWSKYLDLYKIGLTRRDAQARARELNEKRNMEWEVIASIETEEPEKLESLFHKSFSEARVSPKREYFRLTQEQEALFVRLAEDQRWLRAESTKAGMEATRDLMPDWAKFVGQIPHEDDFEDDSLFFPWALTIGCVRPYYSRQTHTITLWFSAEDDVVAEAVSEPKQIKLLHSVFRNAWGRAPNVEIRVEGKADVIKLAGDDSWSVSRNTA